MSTRNKTALFVLGMHRSGTSALTRVLNIFGAEIGDDLFPGHEVDNPTGYWENNAFYKVNEDLLKSLGLDYLVSDNLPAGWLESPAAAEARLTIRTALRTQFANSELVIIKDPRLCFLGPLYFGLLEELGFAVKVIMPLRAPVEVAASLAKRHENLPVEFEAIWARTILSAERISRPYPRVITTYTDLLENPLALYDVISSSLNVTWPTGKQEAAKAVGKFIDPALHRNVSVETSAVPAIRALYAALKSLGSGTPNEETRIYLDSWEAEHLFLFGALRCRVARVHELERRLANRGTIIQSAEEQQPEWQTPEEDVAARRAKALQAGNELLQRLKGGRAAG